MIKTIQINCVIQIEAESGKEKEIADWYFNDYDLATYGSHGIKQLQEDLQDQLEVPCRVIISQCKLIDENGRQIEVPNE